MMTSNQNKTTRTRAPRSIEELEAELATFREQAHEKIEEQAARLEKQIRLARGTREVPKRVIDPARPFFVGDEAAPEALYDAVDRCIQDRPRTLREIVELTGCTNRNRISGVLVKLQVHEPNSVVNLGSRKLAIWFKPRGKRVIVKKA